MSGYSLGMKQRLGIAGALLSDPNLLLLDEPANGLDPAGIVGMRDTLRALAAAGKTVFVSSHILSEVQQLVDVVGIIARGRLVREGPVETLLREEGSIRVRVAPGEVSVAGPVLETSRTRGRGHGAGAGPGLALGPLRSGPRRGAQPGARWRRDLRVARRGRHDARVAVPRAHRHHARPGRGRTNGAGQAARGEPASRGPVEGMRLLRANLRKLRRRPASWVTLVLLIALLLIVLLAVVAGEREAGDPQSAIGARMFVTFPGAYELLLTMILGIGGLLAVTYGAAIAGSEWGWGTLKAAVARGESRSRYTIAGFGAVAIFACLGLLLAFLIVVAGATVGATMLGVSLSGMGDTDALGRMPELFGRAGLALSMNAAFGYAIATIARSQLAGIGVGIGLYFAEGIAGVFLPDVIKWFPFASSAAVVTISDGAAAGMGGGGGFGATLDPNTAVLATIGWLVVSVLVAAVWTERAEIGG